ncbi:hypothetical protein FC093_07655 [Ilyomonas limi]|uniref:Uncharacterized protein n=1 Tax=Ilyomonas limi TaxID=2575867 RepID=A0A4U3L438_9BACT|nr:hypothetical protein [Ilyomonas limi]TKK69941.1 hypothetical protein FC093_07655 [Ilyomonas limi]
MEESLKHLDFLTVETTQALNYFHGKGNRISFFFLGLIQRLQAASPGLRLLTEQAEANIELEFSAGLIIRTLALDYLFALHSYEIHQSNTEAGKSEFDVGKEVELHCSKIFADSIRYTIKHVEDVQQAEWITEEEKIQHYREFSKRYSLFV